MNQLQDDMDLVKAKLAKLEAEIIAKKVEITEKKTENIQFPFKGTSYSLNAANSSLM